MSKTKSDLGQTIRHGAAWLFFGSTGNWILTFLFGIVLARLLAPADFGMLVAIQVFTGLAGFVAGGGMGQALVRAKEATKQDYDVVFTLQLAIGVLIYVAFFFASPSFARWYDTPAYADLLRVSALSFIVRPFFNVPNSILYRQMRFRPRVGVNLTSLLVSNGVSILLAFLGYGVWSLILGGLIGAVMGAALVAPLAHWRPGLSLDLRRGGGIARYGMLVTIGDFIIYLRGQASNFVISRTLGLEALGLFNKGHSLASTPQGQVTGSVYQVTFRALASEHDNLDRSQYLFLRSITLVSVYTWPAFLVLAWLSLPIIRIIYGEKWSGSALPMSMFAIAGPIVMLEMLSGCVLAARNWLDREIPVQTAQLVVVVLAVIAGLPYGLPGVALGAAAANIYVSFHMSWLACKCLSMRLRQIASALWIPFLLNSSVIVLWTFIELLFKPHPRLGDFYYLLLMSSSGGALYMLLFFFVPIPALANEKQRWLALFAKILPRIAKAPHDG